MSKKKNCKKCKKIRRRLYVACKHLLGNVLHLLMAPFRLVDRFANRLKRAK